MTPTQLVTRDLVFDRVEVDFSVLRGARVSWSLFRNFLQPGPYTYQLQVSDTPVDDDSAWKDVGAEQENVFAVVDDQSRRVTAKEWDIHYRVRLRTADGDLFYSEPAPIYGILGRRDWLFVREKLRQFSLYLTKDLAWSGYLLKRIRTGDIPDPFDLDVSVSDPVTGEVIDSQSLTTYGTPFEGGYYQPVPCLIDLSAEGWGPKAHGAGNRSTVDPQKQLGISSAYPRISSKDIFVHTGSDRRYEAWKVEVKDEVRGVPVTLGCEWRLLPASDIAYNIEVP